MISCEARAVEEEEEEVVVPVEVGAVGAVEAETTEKTATTAATATAPPARRARRRLPRLLPRPPRTSSPQTGSRHSLQGCSSRTPDWSSCRTRPSSRTDTPRRSSIGEIFFRVFFSVEVEVGKNSILFFSFQKKPKTFQDILCDGSLRLRLRLERGFVLWRPFGLWRGRRVVVGREAAPLGRAEG